MRSLYILRHGAAEWTSSSGDHGRDLQERGREEARTVGRFLSRKDEAPQIVYCSSAKRAQHTAEIAKAEGDWASEIRQEAALYESSTAFVIDVVRATDPALERVLVCGHQPTCGILIAELTRSVAPDFPPATLARLDFQLESWYDLAVGSGKLEWIASPSAQA